MEILLIIVFGLFGTVVGSFLNVCIDRLPAGKSIVRPPSHCDSCQHRLSPADLVPLVSYLWLRRRCRYCGAPIPWRPFWVELGTGVLFAFNYWYYGLSVDLAVVLYYVSLFMVIAVIDLEHQLILDKVTFPAIAIGLVIAVFYPPPGIFSLQLAWPWPGLIHAVTGALIGLLFMAVIYFLALLIYRREGLGLGDVKLAVIIGLATGPRLVLLAITLGALMGGLTGIMLILFKLKRRTEPIPLGTFLAPATVLTLFWGNDILAWYSGLLQF
jgi:prepilin signal peptidase PulO-like enzyme (type II secretory pathway)